MWGVTVVVLILFALLVGKIVGQNLSMQVEKTVGARVEELIFIARHLGFIFTDRAAMSCFQFSGRGCFSGDFSVLYVTHDLQDTHLSLFSSHYHLRHTWLYCHYIRAGI